MQVSHTVQPLNGLLKWLIDTKIVLYEGAAENG